MKSKFFIIGLFIQFCVLKTAAQTPTPKLDVKQSTKLVFLDSETNKQPSVKFTSIFENNGTKRGETTWVFSGKEGKDWKYISVRRTMTYLEQSIKSASEAFVFSPNNSTT